MCLNCVYLENKKYYKLKKKINLNNKYINYIYTNLFWSVQSRISSMFRRLNS